MTDLLLIQSRIFEIRGIRVMLDRDLASLYGVETKVLNQAVKRNIRRFPSDFMFQLTKEELNNWKSQIVTSNSDKMGLRRPPYAFTEQGVAMLSGVLNSNAAIDTNIKIMRAFVAVRRMLALPDTSDRISKLEEELESLKKDMNDSLADQNDINESTRAQIDAISTALAELQVPTEKKKYKPIGFVIPNDDKE
ncbi:MAG: ORF6N domain-containing protein [Prevotella sp.]|nr:ORF6N domain-containing protein [Prevotella sp.]